MAEAAPRRRTRKPAAEKSDEPVFVAARPMKRNGVTIRVGDVIADAASWPRLESWIRAGYVKQA